MKNSLFSLIVLSLFALPSLSNAADISTIVLDEGTTPVTLSLVNHSSSDLSTVAVAIDQTKLPAWLSIQNTPQTVNVPKGEKSRDNLLLQFSVTDAPAGAEITVPLTFRDSYGNVWNSPVRILISGLLLS
jgi:hypothetical protein